MGAPLEESIDPPGPGGDDPERHHGVTRCYHGGTNDEADASSSHRAARRGQTRMISLNRLWRRGRRLEIERGKGRTSEPDPLNSIPIMPFCAARDRTRFDYLTNSHPDGREGREDR